jgi:MoxR-like ATPase
MAVKNVICWVSSTDPSKPNSAVLIQALPMNELLSGYSPTEKKMLPNAANVTKRILPDKLDDGTVHTYYVKCDNLDKKDIVPGSVLSFNGLMFVDSTEMDIIFIGDNEQVTTVFDPILLDWHDNEVKTWLEDNVSVMPQALQTLLKGTARFETELTKMKDKFPIFDDNEYVITAKHYNQLLYAVYSKSPVLLTGETGSGKTVLAKMMSKHFLGKNLPIQNIFEGGHMTDPETYFFGSTALVRSKMGDSTVTKFTPSTFAQILANPEPQVIVFDEFLRAPQEAQNMLLTLLTDRVLLSPYGGDPIHLHKDSIIILITNEGVGYNVGSMDSAIRNRCVQLGIKYFTEAQEIEFLTKKFPTLTKNQISKVVKVITRLRKEYYDNALTEIVSVRHSILICEQIQFGIPDREAISSLIEYYPAQDESKVSGTIASFA